MAGPQPHRATARCPCLSFRIFPLLFLVSALHLRAAAIPLSHHQLQLQPFYHQLHQSAIPSLPVTYHHAQSAHLTGLARQPVDPPQPADPADPEKPVVPENPTDPENPADPADPGVSPTKQPPTATSLPPADPNSPTNPLTTPAIDDAKKNPSVDDTALSANTTQPTNTTDSMNAPLTTNAYEEFSLLLMEELSSLRDNPFQLVDVFKNGTFQGMFQGGPNTSDINALAAMNTTEWYADNSVRDRITFQFRFDLEAKYDIAKPELYVAPDAGMEPKLEDFQLLPYSGSGSFTILYSCIMGKPGIFPISIHMPITTEKSFDTGWVKECGEGRNSFFDIGFENHQGDDIVFNSDGTYNGMEEKKTLDVGPMDASTSLFIKLKEPVQNLDFLTPYIMTDSSDVSVKLRGTIAAGSLNSDSKTSFNVLYSLCTGPSTANIKFMLAIPPWDNVTATWRKDCGGTMSQALLIGTEGEQSFNVMQEGELKPAYNVADDTTLDTVDSSVQVVDATIQTMKFYFTNSDVTSDIHFQTISMTMSDPDVVRAVVTGNGVFSLGSAGGVLRRKEVVTLSLYLICKKAGRSVVLVTLPTVRYQNVEFGFVKECDGAPLVYSHSGFLRTADSLVAVILVLAVIGAIAFCIYRARKGGNKYAPVSTSETEA